MSAESNDDGCDETSEATSNRDLEPLDEEARRFFEISLDLFCIADSDGYFLRVNPQFERVLGYTTEELTSRPILDFVHPEDRAETREVLSEISECERDVKQFVNRYVCKDGSIVWLEWRARSYRSGDLSYASARDITDLKRIERERRKYKQQFERAQKLESVGVLAGGIAHDFNNLLMTILANTGLIRSDLDEDHPAREWVDAIVEASHRGADLCDQLLAYAGEGQFDVAESNLSAIVRQTDHLLETAVPEATDISYDLAEDLPDTEIDTTQIQQVLMNVVQNASEAIGDDEKGTIRIATGTRRCDREMLASTYLADDLPEGCYVYLTVEDDGAGMIDEEMNRLFEPFYTTKETGRGLGLSATLGIVRAHRGALEVETEPDEGTRFTFYLPAIQTARPFSSNDTEQPPHFSVSEPLS